MELLPEIICSVLPPQTERVFIAYSGGVDSHVLLHLASASVENKAKITAVYVHHGLQQEADAWKKHCAAVCFNLDVKFQCLKVNAQKFNRQSPEEVARDARYAALKTLLAKNDVLLFGQHREDQMETVLLQLFRGAGVQGLSAMPVSTNFGLGVLCRPLLDVPNQLIKDYAVHNKLQWIEDPSNNSDAFDRNFLRNRILPQLKQRWPALDKTVARSARHCANTHKIATDLAIELLNQLYDVADQTLNISHLLELDYPKQQLVIRQWFARLQLRMPSEKILQTIVIEVAMANSSAQPEILGKAYRIKRYRNKLYCLPGTNEITDLRDLQWPAEQMQLMLSNGQQLVLKQVAHGISKKCWLAAKVSVRFGKRTEKIKLSGRAGHHTLKKLYQENAIPPWERNKIPLIYLDEKLAAVSDLWMSADFISIENDNCYQISLIG